MGTILFIDGNFSNFDSFLDELPPKSYTNLLLVLGYSLIKNLDALIAIWNQHLLSYEAKICVFDDRDGILVGYHIGIKGGKILTHGSSVVFVIDSNFEVVIVLSSVDLEAFLILFVGNAKPDS